MRRQRTPGGIVARVAAVTCLSACAASGTQPTTSESDLLDNAAVFDVNVDTRSGQVSITPGAQPGIQSPASFSIVAGDAVNLTARNFVSTPIGQFVANKIRVRFDVRVTNRLSATVLTTPSFPAPPSGVTGLLLFPFAATPVTRIGGSADSTVVVVTQPTSGAVVPSTDWNGTGGSGSGGPFNFFRDSTCASAPNLSGQVSDCYRYVVLPAPLGPGQTTPARTVGFDVDPDVASFTARILLAADLSNVASAFGSITGQVTSPTLGPLSNVSIVLASNGIELAVTDASGSFDISRVPTGPVVLRLDGLPTGCAAPPDQGTNVIAGSVSAISFDVTCGG
jgi:hypothetical protein